VAVILIKQAQGKIKWCTRQF